jgi:hypothetical protein
MSDRTALPAGLHDANGNPVGPHDRPPDVTDLPLIPKNEIGPLPKGLEARMLGGNWYGNGPEIVIWHPKQEVHYNVPLCRKETMLPHAVRVVSSAARAAANGMSPYKDSIGEGYWVTNGTASNIPPDTRRSLARQRYKENRRA